MAYSSILSREILEAALHGLEMQKQRLKDHLAQVKSMLGKRLNRPSITETTGSVVATGHSSSKRVLSAEAKRRIAAAQKKMGLRFTRLGQRANPLVAIEASCVAARVSRLLHAGRQFAQSLLRAPGAEQFAFGGVAATACLLSLKQNENKTLAVN